jgi:hypothetical protein
MLGITGGYVFLVFMATVAGAIAGFIAHHIRAATGRDERPLWDDGLTGFVLRQEHEMDKRQGWKFGADGWYDGLSDSNLVRYIAIGAAVPLVVGLINWSPGIAAFIATCQRLSGSGWAPGFCP